MRKVVVLPHPEGPRSARYVEVEVVDRGERRELLGQSTQLQSASHSLVVR
jgi:hypothetical protein